MLGTHADRLERWLGAGEVARISDSMRSWYGPPIAVAGVPGNVWAHRGGDFRGPIRSGQVASLKEYLMHRIEQRIKRWAHRQWSVANMAGFASASDLLAEATQGGKFQPLLFNKTLGTQAQFGTNSAWRVGPQPAAGAAGSAAPGGRACASSTTGALVFNNAASGDYLAFISAFINHSVGGTTLLYDRIFDVAKTMASVATEAVTGVPTRYQSTTTTAQDYIGGNFLFVEVGATALANTAHNWTTCLYNNQLNAGATLPSLVGNALAIADRLDHPLAQWFAPMATGDSGVMKLTKMQCSASVATGLINFVIGHPIAWLTTPIALVTTPIDGFYTAFQVTRIFDSACLAFLNVMAAQTTSPVIGGQINTVSG